MDGKITRKEFMKYAQYDDRLLRLEKRIKEHAAYNRRKRRYCANAAWYGIFKRELVNLVGWNADDIRLQSTAAYDTVYEYLYELLPDCTCETYLCGLF